MDLNELLHQHQVAVMKAAAVGDDTARESHFAKVTEYARRVSALRDMPQGRGPALADGAPPTIIYASYAGDPVGGAEREKHGDAPATPAADLPEGVRLSLAPQYFVGPYVYTDRELALAEHARQAARAAD